MLFQQQQEQQGPAARGAGAPDGGSVAAGEDPQTPSALEVSAELRKCLASFRHLKLLLLSPCTSPQLLERLLQQQPLQQRVLALRLSFLSSVDRALPPSVSAATCEALRCLQQQWAGTVHAAAAAGCGGVSRSKSGSSSSSTSSTGGTANGSSLPCCCCSVPSEAVLYELLSAYVLRHHSGQQQLLLPAFEASQLRETVNLTDPAVLRELKDVLLDEQLCMFWCIQFVCTQAAKSSSSSSSSTSGSSSQRLQQVCRDFAIMLLQQHQLEKKLLQLYTQLDEEPDPASCCFRRQCSNNNSSSSNSSNSSSSGDASTFAAAYELHELEQLKETLLLQEAVVLCLSAARSASRVLGSTSGSSSSGSSNSSSSWCSESLYRYCSLVYEDRFCGALAARSSERRSLLQSRRLLRHAQQLGGSCAAAALAGFPLELLLSSSSSSSAAVCAFVEGPSFASLHRDVMSSCLQNLRETLQQQQLQQQQQQLQQQEQQQLQQQQQQEGGAAFDGTYPQGGGVYSDLLYSCYVDHSAVAPLLLAAHAAVLAGYRRMRSSSSSSSSSNGSSLTDEEIDVFLSQATDFVMPMVPYALQLQLLQHDLLQQQQQQQQDPLQEAFAAQLLLLLQDGLQQQQQQQKGREGSSGVLRLLRAYVSLFPYGAHLTLQLLGALMPQPQQQQQQGEEIDCDVANVGPALQLLLLLARPLDSVLLPPIEGLVFSSPSQQQQHQQQQQCADSIVTAVGPSYVAAAPVPIEPCLALLLQLDSQGEEEQQQQQVFDASTANGGLCSWSFIPSGCTGTVVQLPLWRFLQPAAAVEAALRQQQQLQQLQLQQRQCSEEEERMQHQAGDPWCTPTARTTASQLQQQQQQKQQAFWCLQMDGSRLEPESLRFPIGKAISSSSSSSNSTNAVRWPLSAPGRSSSSSSNSSSSRGRLSLLKAAWLLLDLGLQHQADDACGLLPPSAFRWVAMQPQVAQAAGDSQTQATRCGQTDGPTESQTDKRADRRTGRQTNRQTHG
ncbi:hypothetical protein Efla_005458 [Eimeria flavescens]